MEFASLNLFDQAVLFFAAFVLLILWETVMAKMRLFRVPQFLGFAFLLSLLGMLTHVVLETGG